MVATMDAVESENKATAKDEGTHRMLGYYIFLQKKNEEYTLRVSNDLGIFQFLFCAAVEKCNNLLKKYRIEFQTSSIIVLWQQNP